MITNKKSLIEQRDIVDKFADHTNKMKEKGLIKEELYNIIIDLCADHSEWINEILHEMGANQE